MQAASGRLSSLGQNLVSHAAGAGFAGQIRRVERHNHVQDLAYGVEGDWCGSCRNSLHQRKGGLVCPKVRKEALYGRKRVRCFSSVSQSILRFTVLVTIVVRAGGLHWAGNVVPGPRSKPYAGARQACARQVFQGEATSFWSSSPAAAMWLDFLLPCDSCTIFVPCFVFRPALGLFGSVLVSPLPTVLRLSRQPKMTSYDLGKLMREEQAGENQGEGRFCVGWTFSLANIFSSKNENRRLFSPSQRHCSFRSEERTISLLAVWL